MKVTDGMRLVGRILAMAKAHPLSAARSRCSLPTLGKGLGQRQPRQKGLRPLCTPAEHPS